MVNFEAKSEKTSSEHHVEMANHSHKCNAESIEIENLMQNQ